VATIVLPLVVVNWTAQRQMLLTWGEEGAASLSVEEGEGGVSGSELGRRWGKVDQVGTGWAQAPGNSCLGSFIQLQFFHCPA